MTRQSRCPCCGEIGEDIKNSGLYRCETGGCRVRIFNEEDA